MKMRKIILSLLVFLLPLSVIAQEKPKQWDLSGCIQYALDNNIQIRKAKVGLESSEVSTKQAKAELLPSLSAGISQNASYNPSGSLGTYSGSYSVSSSMTLFDGGKLLNNIKEQKLQEDIANNSIAQSEKSIQMSILQTYMKILYADEEVKVIEATVKTSEYQYNRGVAMEKAGSISSVDLAQFESQLSSDKYQLVVAQNTLSTAKLNLQQLLELNPEDSMKIVIPQLSETNILNPIPSLQEIYATALKVMPQINSGKVDIQVSNLETQKAKAGFLPKVNLNASAGTNNNSLSTNSFSTQLSNGFNAGVGVSVSIPIFTNRSNKSALEQARLNEKTAKLNMLDAEKTLLQDVESVYQDALSSQSQYLAAKEKVNALEKSYNLIQQQFDLGLKNTLDLLTEKNNLLAAKQSMMQAKYLSIMDIQILNIYQNLPVEIN